MIIVSISFIIEKLSILSIDLSWHYAPKRLIKRKTIKKVAERVSKLKNSIIRNIGWIMKIDFSKDKFKESTFSRLAKPIIPALVLIPILYIIEDQIFAMFLAVILAGLLAYFISCKVRSKIIITTIFTIGLAITNLIIQSNLTIISKYETMLEFWSVSLGAIGIYLLLFTLLLVPLGLFSWAIIRLIRNLKERKNPLLSLDGNCDL